MLPQRGGLSRKGFKLAGRRSNAGDCGAVISGVPDLGKSTASCAASGAA